MDRELLAQVRRIQVRTNRMVTDVMAGGYNSVFRGSGIEFEEVREFAEGDDLRAVDWNVTARHGRPFVKTYVEERELSVLFVVDLSASSAFGSVRREGREQPRTMREAAAEFCACLALAAARNNDKSGLVAFTDRIERYVPVKKGSAHVLRIVRDALGVEPEGRGTDLTAALDFAGRVQRKRAVVFVVSDFYCQGFGPSLGRLARRHDVVAVQLRDPRLEALPNAGLLRLRDLETRRETWVDSGSRAVRTAWGERCRAHAAGLERELRRRRVDRIQISTDRPVGDPIVRFFQMRESRGRHR